MIKSMMVVAACVPVIMLIAAAEYVCDRIILPEMGLTAPEYVTWFWFTVVTVIAYATVYVASLWIRVLTD